MEPNEWKRSETPAANFTVRVNCVLELAAFGFNGINVNDEALLSLETPSTCKELRRMTGDLLPQLNFRKMHFISCSSDPRLIACFEWRTLCNDVVSKIH